ncbi:hypothetical protein Ga0466249_001703 [Sporomusaceae bacterium BoRhaA]|nr:hypothetical protein [Pelorhabdus rhamnosifermentans]MBU2700611.1 hypothetical protein [Pelorhabdus rhamnosifermentans]
MGGRTLDQFESRQKAKKHAKPASPTDKTSKSNTGSVETKKKS